MANLSQRAYRLALQDALVRQSIVAEVALIEDAGTENTWPTAFREAAVSIYNERADAESTDNPARENEGRTGSPTEERITVGE